jgi:hypothetical protein
VTPILQRNITNYFRSLGNNRYIYGRNKHFDRDETLENPLRSWGAIHSNSSIWPDKG